MDVQLILTSVRDRVNRHPRAGPGHGAKVSRRFVASGPGKREINSPITPSQLGTFYPHNACRRHDKQMGSGQRRPEQSHAIAVGRATDVDAREAYADTGLRTLARAHDRPESIRC